MAAKRTRKKRPEAKSVGLVVDEMTGGSPPRDVTDLAARVEKDGGAVIGRYRDPWGGGWLLLAALPIDRVAPTPFQRDLSETHADRLSGVIQKVGMFLDPIVAVPAPDGYWAPNGMHRLAALNRLGAKSVTALLVPDAKVAMRILALNTEKAHNLKDKSLEVIRIARSLAADSATAKRPESDWAFEFEEPAYLTVGICYEKRPRYAGGAYLPVLRRCEEFSSDAIAGSIATRDERADKLLELDDLVQETVAKLKEHGLKSPYLKPFVVARINPLRFQKAAKPGQKAPRAECDATIDKMLASVRKFDATKVRPQDLASMGGAPPEE